MKKTWKWYLRTRKYLASEPAPLLLRREKARFWEKEQNRGKSYRKDSKKGRNIQCNKNLFIISSESTAIPSQHTHELNATRSHNCYLSSSETILIKLSCRILFAISPQLHLFWICIERFYRDTRQTSIKSVMKYLRCKRKVVLKNKSSTKSYAWLGGG